MFWMLKEPCDVECSMRKRVALNVSGQSLPRAGLGLGKRSWLPGQCDIIANHDLLMSNVFTQLFNQF